MNKFTTNKIKNYRKTDRFHFTISLTANITVFGYLSTKIAASIFDDETIDNKFEYAFTMTYTGTCENNLDVQIEYKYEQERIGFFAREVQETYSDTKLADIPVTNMSFVSQESVSKDLAEIPDLTIVISAKENIHHIPTLYNELVIYDHFNNPDSTGNITAIGPGINKSCYMTFYKEDGDDFAVARILDEIESMITKQMNTNIQQNIKLKENDFLVVKKDDVLTELQEDAKNHFKQNSCCIC